ncbi:MAG: Saccharopine dehydrogenase [Promethearchaeota archaeon]|nr:MAG: Saccharopine dehydrogenase [Candidatus Lokiarchaeota archaeon]
MAKVIVLGGCGVVGSVVVEMLSKTPDFSEVFIGDIDLKKAQALAQSLDTKVKAIRVDANDKNSISNAIKGMDMVVNCIGPYYKYEKPILEVVIEAKINYVDVCDDTGATYDALELDNAAKDAGITVLIGMGSSPGITNVLAAYAANDLLEECNSIDMYHIHGGEPNEGPAVIGHRFYCMANPIPMFLNGEAQQIDPKDSAKYVEQVEFINLSGEHTVYPYPHPEPITIPMYIDGLTRVTNKGSVLPEKYYDLTRKIHEIGLDSKEPIVVKDNEGYTRKILPYDFSIQYLIQQREKLLEETNFGDPKGCVKIVVKGKKKRTKEPRTYVFSLVSEGSGKGKGLGEGTGIPAAFGTILLQRGKIDKKGVIPPEACVNAMDFIQLMKELLEIDDSDEEKQSPIIFQSIDKDGNIKTLEF